MTDRARKKRRSLEAETTDRGPKRSRGSQDSGDPDDCKAGKIRRILMRNFMCHDALEVIFNPNVNFIVGRNGSGKSAVLTALTIGLGARANVTNRGASVKEFIKKGKNSASIDITLVNKGPMAYKPNVYGETISVHRTIGASSTYKIKNWKGEIVSTKRSELDKILRAMNIQIDNPISILNQDISRTFLVASKPEEKYELFMKATLLDVIGQNYKEAEIICEEEFEKLKQYNEILSEERKEIAQLKKDIKRAEEIDQTREEVTQLENELCWALAISEEKKLQKAEAIFKKCEDNLKELQEAESVGVKETKINEKIQELREQIKQAEQEVSSNSETYNKIKQDYMSNRETHNAKFREWRSVQSKIKRLEDDINMIRKEIHRLESGDNAEQSERNQLKQQLSEVEQKLDEVEAMLRTKQTDQMHLEADKMRLLKEVQAKKIELDGCDTRIHKIKRELGSLKMQSDNALTVFGRNIPRLLRRIDEEYSNGRFKKKPCGPLGAFIKMKDPAWSAAVESYLGAGTFSSFCVDNSHDAKVLNGIVKEIFMNERPPQIICSRFYNQVHDVSRHCTRAAGYSNLLDAMDISEPVVANCLIDQREVECVLLIPTSKEACEMMSDARKVPRNCKRAFTQQGDTFYPDPHYRTYGGPRGLRSKFLQVSTKDAIRSLEEELHTATDQRKTIAESYATIYEKEKRASSELISVTSNVRKLRSAQSQYKTTINDIRDKIEANEGISITVLRNEMTELEKKLQQEKSEETHMGEAVLELQRITEDLEKEIKRHRELRQNLDTIVNPIKENIRQFEEEKNAIRMKAQNAAKKLQATRQALQNATAGYEMQQRVTEKAVDSATKTCDRLTTDRTTLELERLIKDAKGKIREIERQFGTIDQLRKDLKDKEAKCGKDLLLAAKIEKSYQAQLARLQDRKELYADMKRVYGKSIQNSFSSVLALRDKKGVIRIDHARKLLELEVNSLSETKRLTNDAKSLSGGERSYSTVAFILALWDCTGLPFYFLDEFDVFMDKVNRRVIMDILLDHTRTHPESQFTFLTPLDTSHILAEDYVTIHQLAPPERGSQIS